VTICILLVLGLLVILFGVANAGKPVGVSNLVSLGGFFAGGFKGFFISLVFVTFAFGGIEMVGVCAGEAETPEKTIPRAVNATLWRLVLFYVGAIFVIVSIYPWDQIGQLGSPFVLVFKRFGITAAAGIVNFVILTAALSSMNTIVYANSRFLYSFALNGNAPKFLAKVSKNEVPINGILVTSAFACLAFPMSVFLSSAFTVATSFATVGILWGWSMILITQIAFRRRKIREGTAGDIKFKSFFTPVGNIITLAYLVSLLIALGIFEGTRMALYIFPIWLLLLVVFYQFTPARKAARLASK